MPVSKQCRVCGGQVSPLDEGVFGSCESCGVVYALQEQMRAGGREAAPQGGFKGRTDEAGKPTSARWVCPDCGTELTGEDDSALQFIIREHLREYHPNRAAG